MEPITIGLIAAAAALFCLIAVGIALLFYYRSRTLGNAYRGVHTDDDLEKDDFTETETPTKTNLLRKIVSFFAQKLKENQITIEEAVLEGLIFPRDVRASIREDGTVSSKIKKTIPITGSHPVVLMSIKEEDKEPEEEDETFKFTFKIFFEADDQLPTTDKELNNFTKITEKQGKGLRVSFHPPTLSSGSESE